MWKIASQAIEKNEPIKTVQAQFWLCLIAGIIFCCPIVLYLNVASEYWFEKYGRFGIIYFLIATLCLSILVMIQNRKRSISSRWPLASAMIIFPLLLYLVLFTGVNKIVDEVHFQENLYFLTYHKDVGFVSGNYSLYECNMYGFNCHRIYLEELFFALDSLQVDLRANSSADTLEFWIEDKLLYTTEKKE